MPAWTLTNGVKLNAGQQQAVLNNEALANAGKSQAVFLASEYGEAVPLTILNRSGQALTLQCAETNVDANFVTWGNIGAQAFTPATAAAQTGNVTPGLWYRVVAGAAITAGTVVMAR